MNENYEHWEFRQSKAFSELPVEIKQLALDAIHLMDQYIEHYQLRIFTPPKTSAYPLTGSTSAVSTHVYDGNEALCILKTYYDRRDECVYFCIRADIQEHALTSIPPEKCYRLGGGKTAPFVCHPIKNIEQADQFIHTRAIPFLDALKGLLWI